MQLQWPLISFTVTESASTGNMHHTRLHIGLRSFPAWRRLFRHTFQSIRVSAVFAVIDLRCLKCWKRLATHATMVSFCPVTTVSSSVISQCRHVRHNAAKLTAILLLYLGVTLSFHFTAWVFKQTITECPGFHKVNDSTARHGSTKLGLCK